MDRRHLPQHTDRTVPDQPLDVRDHEGVWPRRERLSAPQGAPNVLLVLLDDMGFGASSAFGGPCSMPTAEALADGGLRYTRFHTTAMCSPTRAALMTGRNHHAVGMGNVAELSTDAPGYDGLRPRSAGTLAQALSHNGYATGAFGKWHQTPPWEQTAAGPLDHWPTREGFDRFYGFLGGEASQFSPTLVEGTTFVDPPATEAEGYHLSEDLVDRASTWIRDVRTAAPGKPWLAYLAFGATHAPFQLPEAWRGRNRGDFAHGWDEQRERTLRRQKELGVVPQDAELAPWVPGVPHWDDISDDARANAERLMEAYAAFAEHTDAQVGRLVDDLRARGELDNTVVLYVLGDNGASAEGGIEGTLNETIRLNGLEDTTGRIADFLADDVIGGPHTYAHYPVGWAVAMDTPYQWTKQVASHYGGTRNGLVVHWPAGIRARGEVRHQWHHVIDVLPTVLELAGLPQPETVDGVPQQPVDGTSFAYSLNEAEAPDRHTTQYFEMFGNRGIFHEGWTAVTKHRTPWLHAEDVAYADDAWELYDTTTDWTQARDLADENPERLAELQQLFLDEARRHHVLPLDDRRAERQNAAGRRDTAALRSLTLGPGAGRLREAAVPSLKNTSFRVVAEVDGGTSGVLVAQGGRFAGWSLYVVDGRPSYAYNHVGLEVTHVRGERRLPQGRASVELRFGYDGGGVGRGGEVTLLLDGDVVGTGRVERTVPFFFSMDETLDVGVDRGTPVTEDYGTEDGFRFDGRVASVTITAGDDALVPTDDQLLQAVLVTQ
jgi:arylsulfatase